MSDWETFAAELRAIGEDAWNKVDDLDAFIQEIRGCVGSQPKEAAVSARSSDGPPPFVLSDRRIPRESAFLVRCSQQMHDDVKAIGERHGMSINEVTLRMVEYCLAHLVEAEPINTAEARKAE